MGALDPKLLLELYERDPAHETIDKVDARGAGNLDSWLVPYRQTQLLLDRARPALDRVTALAPNAISVHPAVPEGEVWLPTGCASGAIFSRAILQATDISPASSCNLRLPSFI